MLFPTARTNATSTVCAIIAAQVCRCYKEGKSYPEINKMIVLLIKLHFLIGLKDRHAYNFQRVVQMCEFHYIR